MRLHAWGRSSGLFEVCGTTRKDSETRGVSSIRSSFCSPPHPSNSLDAVALVPKRARHLEGFDHSIGVLGDSSRNAIAHVVSPHDGGSAPIPRYRHNTPRGGELRLIKNIARP
jgi:hypothetical protein